MRNFLLFAILVLGFILSIDARAQFFWGNVNGKDAAVNLTNQIAHQNDSKTIEVGTVDPTSLAVNAATGSLYLSNTALFQKLDTGSSTNWIPFLTGSAGSGTDECIARWDGTGDPLLQDSSVCITDAGDMTGLNSVIVDTMPVSSAVFNDASGFLSGVQLTDGQVLIGSSGANPVAAQLTGTANQISINSASGSITLSTPQNLDTAASVEFGNLQVSAVSPSSAVITDASGFFQSSVTTSTEIGYVNGVTSSIQNQLDSKIPLALATGFIIVGDDDQVAQGVAMSGEATIDSAGAVTISSGVIDNDNIATGAAIDFDKMALLTGNSIPITDATGTITTSANLTHNAGVTTATGQLNVDNLRLDGNTLSATNANGDLLLEPNNTGSIGFNFTANQDYYFLADANNTNALNIQGQSAGTNSSVDFFSLDGTGVSNNIRIIGEGTPSDMATNFEALQIGWLNGSSKYRIFSGAGGTGVVRDFSIDMGANTNALHVDSATGWVSVNGSTPSAELTVNGAIQAVSTTKGSKPCPEMTEAQRDATTPTLGDCVINSDTDKYNYYDGANWVPMGFGTGSFENILTDGGFDTAAASGENGLTCGTGNTCAQITTASDYINGTGALEITMGGSNPVDVSHCYDNSTTTSWVNKPAMVLAQIKSTITDLEFCYYNGTTDESCIAHDESKPNYFEYARQGFADSGEDICWRLKSTANPSAGAKIYVDAGYAGEVNNRQDIGTITNGIDYTPTFGAGWGTPTNISFKYYRFGKLIRVIGSLTTGTVSAASAAISLPTNLTLDSSELTINNTTANAGDKVGSWGGDGFADHAGYIVTAPASSLTNVYIAGSHNTTTILIPVNVSSHIASSEIVSIDFTVPIQDWSATSEHTISPMDNVPTAKAAGSATTAMTTATEYFLGWTANATGFDSSNWTNLGAAHNVTETSATYYTVPVTGEYKASYQILTQDGDLDADELVALNVTLDGGYACRKFFRKDASLASPDLSPDIDCTIKANRGQRISASLIHQAGGDLSLVDSSTFASFTIKRNDKDAIGAFPEPPTCPLTVTASTCSGWSTVVDRTYGRPFQDREGNWFIDMHINGSHDSLTDCIVDVAGISIPFSASCSAHGFGVNNWTNGFPQGGSGGTIRATHGSAQIGTVWSCNNIKLDSKPTISGCTF